MCMYVYELMFTLAKCLAQNMMRTEDEAAKEHLAARDLARGQEGEVKAAMSGKQKLTKVCPVPNIRTLLILVGMQQ